LSSPDELRSGEQNWFQTGLGKRLLSREQAWFDQVVADIFGYNAMQLGFPAENLLCASRIPFCFSAGEGAGVALRVDEHLLPVASQSVDLLLLPHVLEFSAHPHQILREAERILIPEGQLLISGFNPYSLWGAWGLARHRRGEYPWRGRFIGLSRIKDWLSLLGLEVIGGRMCCYEPPFQQEDLLEKFRFMEAAGDRWWALAGGVYFIQAQKKVHGMRLIKPGWREALATGKGLAAVPQKTINSEEYRGE
jgi:SAM-dependent methyltransferase